MDKTEIRVQVERIRNALNIIQRELEEDLGDFPIPDYQLVWDGGNLWKPKADVDSRTPGKLVVAFRSDWPEISKVEVLLRDGESWETLIPSGKLDDGRQVFRGQHAGGSGKYAGIRHRGGVKVYIGDDYGFIPHKKAPKFRQERLIIEYIPSGRVIDRGGIDDVDGWGLDENGLRRKLL